MRSIPLLAALSLSLSALVASAVSAQSLPSIPARTGPRLEVVHTFSGHMPVGVAVNSQGRIFVSYPRWEDEVPYSIAELKGGQAVPYPDAALNAQPRPFDVNRFVGVQGLIVDGRDRLWVLDTGTYNLGPILNQQAPKLVGIDTATNRVVKTIRFPANVVLPDTYLNDLRVDLRQGQDGVAYITDSGAKSKGGLIMVDLGTGRSWRKLTGHKSVLAEPKFVPVVDGQPMYIRPRNGVAQFVNLSSDGIAISPDGATLYYTPLASRRLYSVPTAALRDEGLSDAQVSKQVQDLGEKGVSDGMGEDTAGNLYTTNYEQHAVLQRLPSGELKTLVQDPRLIWPDTLAIQGGYMYILSDQLNRQGGYHFGRDVRVKPYVLFRVKVNARPVILK
jgi:sugar lactone lactonase YvrE